MIRKKMPSFTVHPSVPYAFEMHWANLHDVSQLLALQDPITTSSGHSCDIEKLGTVDHVIVW